MSSSSNGSITIIQKIAKNSLVTSCHNAGLNDSVTNANRQYSTAEAMMMVRSFFILS